MACRFLPSLVGLTQSAVDEATDSGTARVALYEASVRIAADHFPLGVGFGRYGSAPTRTDYSPVYYEYGLDRVRGLGPDNPAYVGDTFWPRILGETGVGGLIALLVFVVLLGRDVWLAGQRRYRDPLVSAFVLGAWMVFLQALVETLASSLFDAPPRAYLLFGALGVALSLGRRDSETA